MSIEVYCRLSLVLAAIFLCSFRSTSAAGSPGIRVRVSQRGLSYAGQMGVNALANRIAKWAIPDIGGSLKVPSLGTINYKLTNIKVSNLKMSTPSMTVDPITGIKLSLTGATFTVDATWSYASQLVLGRISASGTVTASITGTSLGIGFLVTMSASGQPSLNVTACECDASSVVVSFGGVFGRQFGLLFNLLNSELVTKVKSAIRLLICPAVQSAVQMFVVPELAKTRVEIPWLDKCVFDYGLNYAPQLANSFVQTEHLGQMICQKDSSSAVPFQPPTAFPAFPSTPRMMSMQVSEYTINTILYTMFKRSFFSINKTISAGILSSILPKDTAGITVLLAATTQPTVTIRTTSVKIPVQTTMTITAGLPGGGTTRLLAAGVNATFAVMPMFSGIALTGTVSLESLSARIVNSTVPFLTDSLLALLLKNSFVNAYVLPVLNEMAARGFPVPSVDYAKLLNGGLQLQEGVATLVADVQFLLP